MKKILLIFIMAFGMNVKAQINLEATYDTASANLYIVTLEVDSDKYVKVERQNSAHRAIILYNLDHSIWKTIDCSSFPKFDSCGGSLNYGRYNFEVLYITQHLFDSDNGIEFMFNINGCGVNDYFTGIYNEDGTSIFTQNGATPAVHLNIPIVFKPIYNTINGAKMILSFPATNQSKVYSIPGTLSNSNMIHSNNSNGSALFSVYPNPTSNQTIINYKLPMGITNGEIIISDMTGKEIKKYSVDNSFDNLIISTNELMHGVYMYSLKGSGKILETKKIIVTD
jgi:hypothetical protein